MQYLNTINHLREHGYRIGSVRREVVRIFSQAKKPLSALAVSHLLTQRKIPANTASIYREIDFLKSQDLLIELYLEPNTRHFESADQEHHHHLVCESCDRIIAIKDGMLEQQLTKLEKHTMKLHMFNTTRHTLEFYGQCQKCQ